MKAMRSHIHIAAFGLLAAASVAVPAAAQVINPNTQPVIPFPTAPPPPPPPAITIPQVPQMASPPKFELQNTKPSLVDPNPVRQRKAQSQPQESYSDRVQRCLDEGAAMGYGPNGRAAYSRSCANR
jgi:outer membrane biosynthesis protein TonB